MTSRLGRKKGPDVETSTTTNDPDLGDEIDLESIDNPLCEGAHCFLASNGLCVVHNSPFKFCNNQVSNPISTFFYHFNVTTFRSCVRIHPLPVFRQQVRQGSICRQQQFMA